MDKDITIKVHVDTSELDAAIEKAEKFKTLLAEVPESLRMTNIGNINKQNQFCDEGDARHPCVVQIPIAYLIGLCFGAAEHGFLHR